MFAHSSTACSVKLCRCVGSRNPPGKHLSDNENSLHPILVMASGTSKCLNSRFTCFAIALDLLRSSHLAVPEVPREVLALFATYFSTIRLPSLPRRPIKTGQLNNNAAAAIGSSALSHRSARRRCYYPSFQKPILCTPSTTSSESTAINLSQAIRR